MEPAPFHDALAEGPPGGAAHWVTLPDGIRLRLAHYPEGDRGTVLMFPGRTEYCEKYGRAAGDFRARGYAMATIDWRGQGLSTRSGALPLVGHVNDFGEFQKDVAALVEYARALDLPRPYYLCAHSMGGAIGLKALYDGLEVGAAAFSAPMWGIRINPFARPVAHAIGYAGLALGRGHLQMPFTSGKSYVDEAPFEGNLLTSDPDMYAYMRRHTEKVPQLALGGPSIAWLYTALGDLRVMMRRPAPAVACITFLGSDEEIVATEAVRDRMRTWTAGRLEEIPGARHEVLMETPEIRTRAFDLMAELFAQAE
jgi:lysophospholipase